MTIHRSFLAFALTVAVPALVAPSAARSNEPLPAVATFSILGDVLEKVGGEHVAVTTLVGPNGDTHVYQPTPSDARAVRGATLLVTNGLEFEGWIDRLVDAAEFDGERVVATDGIEPIVPDDDAHHGDGEDHDGGAHTDSEDHDGSAHKGGEDHDGDAHAEGNEATVEDDEHAGDDHGHGAFDPHAWHDPELVAVYADNIAEALTGIDPGNAGDYRDNLAAYRAELAALDDEIGAMMAALPENRRTVVTSHDAFGYFGRAYGLTFEAPRGLSTEDEASATDVAGLIRQIRERDLPAVFVESIGDRRLLDQIARETGAVIGGTLYTGALSEPEGPAGTYLDMMRHNATTLRRALGPSQ